MHFLELNPELVRYAFRLAAGDDVGALHAPSPMRSVCRALRALAPAPTVLCIPLLRADGATPTFLSVEAWEAYLACVHAEDAPKIHMVSTWTNIVPADTSSWRSDAPATNGFRQLHLRHLGALWAVEVCARAMGPALAARVTSLEVYLSPPPLGGLQRVVSPRWDALEQMAPWLRANRAHLLNRSLPGLCRLTVRSSSGGGGGANTSCMIRSIFFYALWRSIADGIRVRPTPLEELRVLDADADSVLAFVLAACSPTMSVRMQMNDHAWHVSPSAITAYPPKALRVVLPDYGAWACDIGVLAMIGARRVELPGTRAFGPTRSPSLEELGDAADTRTTRMELATRAPCALPAKRWLTVASI